MVDKANYTYTVAPPAENEARKRLLGQTQSSAQKINGDLTISAASAAQIHARKQSSVILPAVEVGSTTL